MFVYDHNQPIMAHDSKIFIGAISESALTSNKEISSPVYNWMIILWNLHLYWTVFFNYLNSNYELTMEC